MAISYGRVQPDRCISVAFDKRGQSYEITVDDTGVRTVSCLQQETWDTHVRRTLVRGHAGVVPVVVV